MENRYNLLLITDRQLRIDLARHLRSSTLHVLSDAEEAGPYDDVNEVVSSVDEYGEPAIRVTVAPEGLIAVFDLFSADEEDFDHMIDNIRGVIECPGDFGFEDE